MVLYNENCHMHNKTWHSHHCTHCTFIASLMKVAIRIIEHGHRYKKIWFSWALLGFPKLSLAFLGSLGLFWVLWATDVSASCEHRPIFALLLIIIIISLRPQAYIVYLRPCGRNSRPQATFTSTQAMWCFVILISTKYKLKV